MKECSIEKLSLNPMTMFGREWCLIDAGNEANGYNAMTIAWGHIGAIWDRNTPKGKTVIPTATVYLRPQRYTKEFFDREELFTICTFDSSYKKALGYMGGHSGRNEDKAKNAGLTPIFIENTTAFAEARMIFVCRKLYHAPLMESGFVDTKIAADNYPDKDFHEMYVGEIIKIFDQQ